MITSERDVWSSSVPAFETARRILREEAVSRTERRLRVSPELMPAIAAVAAEQLFGAFGELDHRHAGWAMVAMGTLVVRNSERLSSAGGEEEPDPSFTGGIAWSGLLCGVLGDRLLREAHRLRPRSWEPSEGQLAARRAAAELLGEPADVQAVAARRFAAYARAELLAGLPGLDPRQGGFALAIAAAWIADNEHRIAEPLCRRRGLLARRVVTDLPAAEAGCELTASVTAAVADPLIDHAPEQAGSH